MCQVSSFIFVIKFKNHFSSSMAELPRKKSPTLYYTPHTLNRRRLSVQCVPLHTYRHNASANIITLTLISFLNFSYKMGD